MAYHGTDVIYDGITLRNVRTVNFEQKPVRDESDTDRWYNQFDVAVEATVNTSLMAEVGDAARLGVMGPGLSSTNSAAQAILFLNAALGEDRKSFVYRMNGTDLLNITPVDANNGPKVTHLKIIKVSPETIMVEFAVQVALIMCKIVSPSDSQESRPINNRWSCVDDIDDSFRTTRTWRGVMRLSDSRVNPHVFRSLLIPPLASGFRRKKMNFATPANWLELAYEVTDEEMLGDAPPFPATKMNGQHMESVQADVSNAHGECNVTLSGPPGVDKRKLLELATQIVFNKLALKTAGNYLIEHFILVDHIGENANTVEARCRIRHTEDQLGEGSADASNIMGAITAKIGKPLEVLTSPEYDPEKATLLGPHGTASVAGLFASFLQSPCGSPVYLNQGGSDEKQGSKATSRDTQKPEAFVVEGVNSSVWGQVTKPPKFSDKHQQAIFTFYQLDSIIEEESGLVQMPVSAQRTGGGGTFGGAIGGGAGAGSANTSAVVQLHQPLARRIVRLAGERQNAWPEMFNKKSFISSNGITHVCIKRKINSMAPRPNPNQTVTYSITAEYIYAMSRPLNDGEEMPVGALPWDNMEQTKTAIPGDSFKDPQGKRALG